jgi:hypothetical protein
VLTTNTQALKANTQALQANTQALEANVKAAQMNMHLRGEQMQQMAKPAIAQPAKTQEVRTGSTLVKTPVKETAPTNPMPANVPAKTQVLSSALAKAPVKPQAPKLEIPARVAAKPEPGHATAKATAKPAMPFVPAAAAKAPVKPAIAHAKPEIKIVTPQLPKAKEIAKTTIPSHIAPAAKTPLSSNANTYVANKAVKLNQLLQLPLMDKSFDGKVVAKHVAVNGKAGMKEGDVITTQGCLRVVSVEDSAKENETYFLQLTLSAQSGDSCFIVKIPSGELTNLTTKQTADNAKKFIREQLVKGKVPCVGGNLMRKPVYVSITGELAYNAAHAAAMRGPKPVYPGKRGMHAYTAWEITNISRIEFIMP